MRLSTSIVATLSWIASAKGQKEQPALVEATGDLERVRPLNVAIIGAGSAGASSAYHLSKFAESANLPINITVFERNATAGGRSTTVDAYDDPSLPLELGASIFVKVNSILNKAVDEFNLSTDAFLAEDDVPGPGLAVWDGKTFVLEMNEGWWDTAKLLWKYGLAPVKTMRLMRKTVGTFLRMYEEPIFPFASLTETVHDLGLLKVTAATGEQFLLDHSITGSFGWDVVQASTRVNYATNLRYVNGMTAMVCMAAEGGSSVVGGNWQIFDSMITASSATTMFNTEVSAASKRENGSYVLSFGSASSDTQEEASSQQLFDSVILAAPNQFANMDISPALQNPPDKIPYVKLHVTLFTSPHLISPAFFGLSKNQPAPRAILTTLPKDERPQEGREGVGSTGFFSISLLRALTNPTTGQLEYAYKIFSAEPPNSTFLAHLLGLEQLPDGVPADIDPQSGVWRTDITWIYRKVWHSYPYEYPRVTFEEIQLDENLWYTSGIESFISTMETSALMGKNVAKLVLNKWQKELGPLPLGSEGGGTTSESMETKTEL